MPITPKSVSRLLEIHYPGKNWGKGNWNSLSPPPRVCLFPRPFNLGQSAGFCHYDRHDEFRTIPSAFFSAAVVCGECLDERIFCWVTATRLISLPWRGSNLCGPEGSSVYEYYIIHVVVLHDLLHSNILVVIKVLLSVTVHSTDPNLQIGTGRYINIGSKIEDPAVCVS